MDRQLYRLICYMHSTPELKLTGSINDPLDKVELRLYVDADFAGSRDDTKSTSGGFLTLVGENTFFPLCWSSKKQTSTSKSTAESELVSLSNNLFEEGIPMLNFWQTVSGRDFKLKNEEDNEATIKIAKKGFSPKLRSLTRTHKVNLGAIHEEISKPDIDLEYVPTLEQAADIFTKAIDPQKWKHALDLLQMREIKT